ncbi:MAG: prolyl oligopeptidase family serine peptidase [Sedimentisphaerales bacterium]
MYKKPLIWVYVALVFLTADMATPARGSQDVDRKVASIPIKSGLLLTRSGPSGGRMRGRFGPMRGIDPIRSKLVDGTLPEFHPQEGEGVAGQENLKWKRVDLDDKGAVAERGSYLYVPFTSGKKQVLILNASGHSEAYVNGQPHAGDIYNRGDVHFPVLMNEGTNDLFFQGGRGSFKVRLYEPPAPVFLLEDDTTLPDLVVGEAVDTWGAVVVINATAKPVAGFALTIDAPGIASDATDVPSIPPLSIRKVAFHIRGSTPSEPGSVTGVLKLYGRAGRVSHSMPLKLEAVTTDQARKVTFVSKIDGSVQYFALRTATPLSPDDPPPAIVLSCHGAGVQALGQSRAYSTKSWFHLVAPTNRRPFGYDWEDFGRMDAMEVLDIARKTLVHDPSRIYLTGHSMGGHGAWHLAVTYPDRFAATGPSAGWLSRSSYGRRQRETADESPMESLLSRCQKSGDTVALAANLKHMGVYVLHGEKDDNVPVGQARRMAEVLGEFHHDWVFHEEPGKKHWWGNEYNDGGSACVDWPFMFDLFARHALAPSSAVSDVEFVTANPGVSSQCNWLAIEAQIHHLDLSKAHLHVWPHKRFFKGTTENVAVLRLDVGYVFDKEPIIVELDGQTIDNIPYPEKGTLLWFGRQDDQWRCINKPSLKLKGPHRYGAIKDELKHRFLFVYGTAGTPEENAWAFGKARYDAETFWYRGNGSVEIVADSAFAPSRYPDRTVVLYGNAETNRAWSSLLSDSPVQVRRAQVRVGTHTVEGDDLSAFFIQPRKDSDIASVVVVSGSGLEGTRSAYAITFFRSFVRYPDCLVTRVSGEQAGRTENVAVGFFGLDWSVENGEFAFGDVSQTSKP